jgi:hypothetical protein
MRERKRPSSSLVDSQHSRNKALTERYTVIGGLLARLERIVTDLNRLRHGGEVADGFKRGSEIIPLTTVYEDLEIHRLVLGDRYHDLFRASADIALQLANTADESAWQRLGQRRAELQKQLRGLADNDFGISSTSLREPGAA